MRVYQFRHLGIDENANLMHNAFYCEVRIIDFLLRKSMTKRKNNLRAQDPFLAREQEKYSDPLPSREWVIELLEKKGVPVSTEELATVLSIREDEMEFFRRRLGAMVRDGQVHINRRGLVCVAEKLALVKCRIEAHSDGFGFAVPVEKKDGDTDLVLYERQMRGLMHGDIVTVRPVGVDRRGRREGQVLDIIERANTTVVARLAKEGNIAVAIPEDKRISQSIVLDVGSIGDAKDGQVINVELTRYPEKNLPATGKVTEVLGDYADSGMEIEIAVRKHHLPHKFSPACLKAAGKIPANVKPAERKGRVDLRELPLVTIDGETARDFDDAVFAEKVGRNYRLVVAIADVSHYVKDGDGIDIDARERGTSVYFPRRVIPMLPENLSNGICSLNPDVERLCMVCDMIVTNMGNVKSYEFYPAVMRSHARLTYTQVWQWIESGEQHDLKPQIDTLYKLYQKLLAKRQQRGAMEFDSIETQMIFNDNGKIDRIEPVVRNEAHRLIEECMLAANVCAAEFLLKNKHPSLYRNHKGPTPEKLETLRTQLALLGMALGGGDNPTPKDYAALAEQFTGRPDKELLQVMLLRSMQQAMYEAKNDGHFGLAYQSYTHFTSPIRRYPDLTVHRAIKAVLLGETYQVDSWQGLGTHTSYTERRADEASKGVENWLKTYYMQDKVGEVFAGRISGLTNFGLFVTLNDLYIDGLVHISDLGEDYFNYRPEIMAIEGERSGVQFKMGDAVVVRVASANLDTGKIDLSLISGGEKSAKGDRKPRENSNRNSRGSRNTGSKSAEAEANTSTSKRRKTSRDAAAKVAQSRPPKSRKGSRSAQGVSASSNSAGGAAKTTTSKAAKRSSRKKPSKASRTGSKKS